MLGDFLCTEQGLRGATYHGDRRLSVILGRLDRGVAAFPTRLVRSVAGHAFSTQASHCYNRTNHDKGKPAARRGRKAYGPLEEVAGLPKTRERVQVRNQQEWKPNAALMSTLGGVFLPSGPDQDGELARLKPHVEEALKVLTGLYRQRGLSEKEKERESALSTLLLYIEFCPSSTRRQ